jgi:hypothetical protein
LIGKAKQFFFALTNLAEGHRDQSTETER